MRKEAARPSDLLCRCRSSTMALLYAIVSHAMLVQKIVINVANWQMIARPASLSIFYALRIAR